MSKNSIRSNRRDSKNQSKQSNISTKVKSDETCNSETNGEKSFGGREELTSIFFNFMLETIVESREAQLVSSSVSDLPQNLEKVIYKDVTEDDFTKSEVMGTLESNVLLKLKHPQDFRESDSKANRMELSGASESRLITYVESNSKNSAQQTQDILIEMESIIFLNGNQYLGEVSEGIMHGKGTFYWTDGTIYEGTFNEGFPTGIGKMILPDLATYNGEFFKGEFHGGGTLNVINTSMIYSGNWNDGKKCGAGWLLYQPKDWYEGEWLEGHRHGFGFRQYRMGGCYEGSWIKGEKSGKGMMLYSNNNIYKGGWNNEVPHGYGEYYWNSFVNKTLVYPMTPWFKGTWNKGCRHGAGVMNFGSESGARLAGIWLHNLKHGPGVMICGNGHAIQKAPLFLHDKAVLTDPDESVEPPLNHPTPEEETEINNITLQQQKQTFHDVSTANSYPDIIKEINKKIPMENINPEIVESIKAKQSKRKIPDINHVFNCNQIETPIHASPEHVDLNHFIDSVLQFSLEKVYSSGRLSFEPLQMDNVKNRTYSVLRIIEQTQIKNTITLHLVKLKDLYERYACVATEEEVDFPKVMIRLFLWQLYRDIELTTNGLSLFEVDFGLADNPQSCVEAVHDPFEPIYFWQFIQSLVGTSVLLHKKGLLQIEPKGALLSSIFKHFITKQLLNKMNGTRGMALKEYKDLLPLKKMYGFYLNLGQNLTARSFLNNICVKKGTQPPCYLNILKNSTATEKGTHENCKNVLVFDQQVEFIGGELSLGERPEIKESIIPEDAFRNTLFGLRSLGPRRVLSCLCKICPDIKKGEFFVNMDYPINFLEFYETVLLCASTLVRIQMKKIERRELIEKIMKEREENPKPKVEVSKKSTKKKK